MWLFFGSSPRTGHAHRQNSSGDLHIEQEAQWLIRRTVSFIVLIMPSKYAPFSSTRSEHRNGKGSTNDWALVEGKEEKEKTCLSEKCHCLLFLPVSSQVYFLPLRLPFSPFYLLADGTLPDWCWLDDVSSPHESHTVGIVLLIVHVQQCLLMQRSCFFFFFFFVFFSSEVPVGWC